VADGPHRAIGGAWRVAFVDRRGMHFGDGCGAPFLESRRATEQPRGGSPEPSNGVVRKGNAAALRRDA
jgi:hypothetical protein